jgi:hypothetical protein
MKNDADYLRIALIHEARESRPHDDFNIVNGGAFGALSYLAFGVACEGSAWCKDEIKRLVQLGKDLEAAKESEKVAA